VEANRSAILLRPGEGESCPLWSPANPLTIKAAGDQTGGTLAAFEETIDPRVGPPLHVHRDSDELLYVLAGEFTFAVGDRRLTGAAGTCVFVPRGATHAWLNAGAAPGRMLFVFSPAGFERLLQELSRRPEVLRDPAGLNRLSAAHGTDYVGPPLAELEEAGARGGRSDG
jgi:quercetin dioxygenase-like cupin family protein